MTEATGKRKIGMGMKPRGAKIESIIPQAASADEGQAEEPVEAITTDQEQGAGGNRLEAESVQNLDSENSATVADEEEIISDGVLNANPDDCEKPFETDVSVEMSDALEKALADSADRMMVYDSPQSQHGGMRPATAEERETVNRLTEHIRPPVEAHAGAKRAGNYEDIVNAEGEVIGMQTTEILPIETIKGRYFMGIDTGSGTSKGITQVVAKEAQAGADLVKIMDAETTSDLAGKRVFEEELLNSLISLGEQPNGTYKLIVTLEEGYIEPVRQWAESDGVTVEKWVTNLIQTYLESWSQAAKGR